MAGTFSELRSEIDLAAYHIQNLSGLQALLGQSLFQGQSLAELTLAAQYIDKELKTRRAQHQQVAEKLEKEFEKDKQITKETPHDSKSGPEKKGTDSKDASAIK